MLDEDQMERIGFTSQHKSALDYIQEVTALEVEQNNRENVENLLICKNLTKTFKKKKGVITAVKDFSL